MILLRHPWLKSQWFPFAARWSGGGCDKFVDVGRGRRRGGGVGVARRRFVVILRDGEATEDPREMKARCARCGFGGDLSCRGRRYA
ncbi:hypothetical protein F511_31898 [Dorcoceras hygrometricum]|uniref:Uncharacterized protein n=1 Tax=Dorcoceras hygrometricum TaxID=472368 RepID=A0A2Z7CL57_9LAMI|nr:hypothetical protein F511_31898 [Dorcoceras hygrometricum]